AHGHRASSKDGVVIPSSLSASRTMAMRRHCFPTRANTSPGTCSPRWGTSLSTRQVVSNWIRIDQRRREAPVSPGGVKGESGHGWLWKSARIFAAPVLSLTVFGMRHVLFGEDAAEYFEVSGEGTLAWNIPSACEYSKPQYSRPSSWPRAPS